MNQSNCSFDPCDRPVNAKGLCNAHYMQARRGETLRPASPPPEPKDWGTCSFDPCSLPVANKTLGLCSPHYHQSRRDKPLEPTHKGWESLRQKIEYYLDKQPDGCWLWTRATSDRGYGHVYWDGRVRPVHRAYLIELGFDVPDGMDIDHLCRVTGCANPDHLEVVTHQVNIQRSPTIGRWKRK